MCESLLNKSSRLICKFFIGSPASEERVPAWVVIPLELVLEYVVVTNEQDAKLFIFVWQVELASSDVFGLIDLITALSIRKVGTCHTDSRVIRLQVHHNSKEKVPLITIMSGP